MPGSVPDFVRGLEQARKVLNKVKSPQLHSQIRRDSLRELVEKYFNDIRPSLIGASEQDDDVAKVDGIMQELLVLCHKQGSVNRYKRLLLDARKGLIILDARIVASANTINSDQISNNVDALIIQTLNQFIPSAALSYQQALIDLQTDQRLSWRGPATDLREALRETLDYLAPDKDVIEMSGYKQSTETNGPTMKQKVQFILKRRGMSKVLITPAVTATESVESTVGTFVRSVYTRSNVSTHTPTEKSEVIRVRDFIRVVLCELLEISS